MRQIQFPDVYTTWEKMKDIKPGDSEYIKQYLEYIKNNNASGAGAVLQNLKHKVMHTRDWQERCDVVDEMLDFMEVKTEEDVPRLHYTQVFVGKDQPTQYNIGDIWFDTN